MSFRKLPVIAGMVVFSAPFSLLANTHQDEIIVTANRTEQSIDTILAPVTLIDRDLIEQSQASSIYDLLRKEAGVQLIRNGGRASITSLFLRGTNDDHTLILIDGVRAGSATAGTTALETLSLDQVERIEIVKGPRSALYGSDAIGGVIQIFTRSASQDQTVLALGFGHNNTRKAGLSSSLAYESGSVALSATRETSDGYDIMFADDQLTGDPAFDADDDEYELRDVSLKWSHRFSDALELTWSNWYSEDESHYDSQFGTGSLPYSESRNVASSLALNLSVSEQWGVDLKAGFAEDHLQNLDEFLTGSGSENLIETERYDYSVINRFSLSNTQQLVAGVDFTKEQVEPNYAQDERENIGAFAQYLLQVDAMSFSFGGRYDDSDTFGSTTTGDIAVGYAFSAALEVILSHGTAFKAPTFNDLFWPEQDYSVGNPDVVPEESKNTELQLRGDLSSNSYYQASVFYNEIENLINWAPSATLFGPGGFAKYTPSNVAEARIRGAELSYHVTLDSWHLALNSSYIEPKDRSSDQDLVRRARTAGSLDISRQGDGYGLGLTVSAKGQRKGDQGEPGGYSTVDIRLEKAFGNSLLAKFKIDNLFNRQFVSVPGYNDIGRFAFLELQYTLKH